QRNIETTQRLNEETAKGVDGSDQVVAANERLVRTQQQVADAQAGVAQSASQQAGAQQKAADAMAKLSPNARDFINTMLGWKPVIADVRNEVQDIGFEGLAGKLDSGARTLIPALKPRVLEIARGWNENFNQLFDSIGSENSRGLLDRILGNTADGQSRLTK